MSMETINKKRGRRHARHNINKKKRLEKESENLQDEVLPSSTTTNIIFNPKQVYIIFKLFYI